MINFECSDCDICVHKYVCKVVDQPKKLLRDYKMNCANLEDNKIGMLISFVCKYYNKM